MIFMTSLNSVASSLSSLLKKWLRKAFKKVTKGFPGCLLAAACILLLWNQAPAFEPNTLELGPLEIHPSFHTDFTYNTNISLSHDGIPDMIIREVPGISLQWGRLYVPVQKPRLASPYGLSVDFLLDLYVTRIRPRVDPDYLGKKRAPVPAGRTMESALLHSLKFRKFAFDLSYEPQFIQLVDHPEFNSIDHELTFSGDARFPGGLYMRVDETFLTSTAINSYRNDVVNFSAQQRAQGIGYNTNLISFTLGYNFYADYALLVTYMYHLFHVKDFDATQVLPDLTLLPVLATEWKGIDSGTLGLSMHTVGIYMTKQFQRKTGLSVGYVLGRLRGNLEDFGLQGSFFGGLMPFTVNVTRDPRDALLQELRVGFQRILSSKQSVFGWQVPKTLVEGVIAHQWRDFETLEFQVHAAGVPVLMIPWKRKGFREFFAEVKLVSQLRERTRVELTLSRYPQEALGGDGSVVVTWGANLSLTQRIRYKWTLNSYGGYRYGEHMLDDSSERDYSDYEAGASLTYRIQTWLTASLMYQFLARQGDFDYNTFHSQRAQFRILVSF